MIPDWPRELVAASGADVIFDLAGEVSGSRDLSKVQSTLRTNLVGGVNILSAGAEIGCQRLILIGSGDEPTGNNAPCSPYAAAKAALTSYAKMFRGLYATPVTIARVFMAYGPDQPDETKIIPYVIASLSQGRRPKLSSGQRQCDWVFIEDVVDALLALATTPAAQGRVMDVGTGVLHTVRHVVDTIIDLMSNAMVPDWGAVADRAGETEDVADVRANSRGVWVERGDRPSHRPRSNRRVVCSERATGVSESGHSPTDAVR